MTHPEPQARVSSILKSLSSVVPIGLAVLLILFVVVKAFVDFDVAWDSVAYHLPFSALRVGIVDSAHYQLTGIVKRYYDGFPVLGDYVRGWLWMALGRPEASNLLSVFSFLCLVAYAWRVLRIPFAWVTLGLAAIPAVQVSLARNQLDLPANAFMAIFVLSACDAFSSPAGFTRGKFAIGVVSAALAAHLKPQMVVQVGLVLVAAAIAVTVLVARRRGGPIPKALSRLRLVPTLVLGVVSLVLVYSEALYHWYRLGNPFYPLAVNIGPFRVFDGPLPPWGLWPEPVYSAHYLQPFRWLLSVLEFRAFDFRRIPYTLGNGEVPAGAMSMRVGGYMGLAVLFSLAMFFLSARTRRDATARTFSVALVLATVFAAFPPGSHEIRYAMYWMMLLVLGTLFLLADQTGALVRESRIYKMFLGCTFLYVLLITGAEHVTPRFRGVAYFEKYFNVEAKLEEAVRPGDTICLRQSPQLAFLYSPNFHPALAASRPYSVRSEGFSPENKDFLSKESAVCRWVSP